MKAPEPNTLLYHAYHIVCAVLILSSPILFGWAGLAVLVILAATITARA